MKRFITALVLISCLCMFISCEREEASTLAPSTKSSKIVRLSSNYSKTSFLVKFDAPLTEEGIENFSVSNKGATLTKVFPSTPGKEALEKKHGLDCWYQVEVPEGQSVEKLVENSTLLSSVKLVEYNSFSDRDYEGGYAASQSNTKAGSIFNDPMLSDQWHYQNTGDKSVSPNAVAGADINVYDVWNQLTCGDKDIIVAVVDEGIKYTHPDLKDNMWVNPNESFNGKDDDGNGYKDDVYGYNFVTNGAISWGLDGDDGHGTHCAGTIAAVNNNGIGVCGVAGGSGKSDGCRLMSCQVFSGGSGGSASMAAKAIKYAADMGASVISCSFGYKFPFESDNHYIANQGSAEIDAIHYFEDNHGNNPVLNGNIAVFSSGNNSDNFAHYPGAFVDIISVSAFAPDFLPAYYTDYGPGCNISAPGGEFYHIAGSSKSMVLSTLCSEINGGDYGFYQGTSMACPHVSGVVALGLSYAKKLGRKFDRDEFKRMILSSVNDIDQRIANTAKKTYVGRGDLAMAPYYHQMGTGAIDAWRLMMKIEGTPTLTSQTGKKQYIDLTSIFGTASVSLTYLSLTVPQETVESLGLQKISPSNTATYPAAVDAGGYAYVQFGRLYIHPTKIGSGKLSISAVGGGDHLGGGDNPPGGMNLTQEVSLIARSTGGANGIGGWL